MAFRPEVHVNDVGTLYRVRLRDGTGPVDPSDATTKQIIFELSDGNVVTKTATVVEEAPEFYLTYEVQVADGYSGQEFHPQAGPMKMQGRLAWSDGSTFSTDILTTDEDGLPLRVHANIGDSADVVVTPATDTFLQAGTGAVARTYQHKVRESFSVKDFGATGDGSTDDYAAFVLALQAIEALADRRGLELLIPRGIYKLSQRIELKRRIMLTGEGGQSDGGTAYTADPQGNSTLLCDEGGILVDAGSSVGYYSTIRNLEIRSSNASGNDGIRIVGRAFVENCHVVGFGGHGINITASSPTGNANCWRVERTRLEANGGSGLRISGTDANAGNAYAVDSTDNAAWGFYTDATHGSTFVGCSDEGNTLGGVKCSNRSVWVGHYNEGGQPANELDEPGVIIGGVWFSDFASGMEPLRISDDKVVIGAGENPAHTGAQTSTSARGFYADQGASIVNQVFGLAATGRVAHGLTSYAPTATWFAIEQATASDGGARLRGLGDDVSALYLNGYGNGETTAEGASDLAHVIVEGAKRSGTAKAASGSTANLVAFQNAGTNKSFIKGDGTFATRGTYGVRVAPDHLLVGTSSITSMAAGIRADVLTSTNEFLSFRGTGRLAHGVTTLADTTTLALWQVAGSSGGVQQLYFSASTTALDVRGIATGEDTTTGSAGVAPVMLDGRKANGTGTQAIGDTGNLFVLSNAGTGRILVKGNGDLVLLNGGITLPAANITLDATTGTKLGTATTQKLGFYNATPVVRQTDGAGLTNNVTSGGTTDVIANYTDLTTYANDSAAIRNDIYQLARKVKIIGDALRTYGLLS